MLTVGQMLQVVESILKIVWWQRNNTTKSKFGSLLPMFTSYEKTSVDHIIGKVVKHCPDLIGASHQLLPGYLVPLHNTDSSTPRRLCTIQPVLWIHQTSCSWNQSLSLVATYLEGNGSEVWLVCLQETKIVAVVVVVVVVVAVHFSSWVQVKPS